MTDYEACPPRRKTPGGPGAATSSTCRTRTRWTAERTRPEHHPCARPDARGAAALVSTVASLYGVTVRRTTRSVLEQGAVPMAARPFASSADVGVKEQTLEVL